MSFQAPEASRGRSARGSSSTHPRVISSTRARSSTDSHLAPHHDLETGSRRRRGREHRHHRPPAGRFGVVASMGTALLTKQQISRAGASPVSEALPLLRRRRCGTGGDAARDRARDGARLRREGRDAFRRVGVLRSTPAGFEDRLRAGGELPALPRPAGPLDRVSSPGGFREGAEVLAKSGLARAPGGTSPSCRPARSAEETLGPRPCSPRRPGGPHKVADAPRLLVGADRLEHDALAACLAHSSLVRGLAELRQSTSTRSRNGASAALVGRARRSGASRAGRASTRGPRRRRWTSDRRRLLLEASRAEAGARPCSARPGTNNNSRRAWCECGRRWPIADRPAGVPTAQLSRLDDHIVELFVRQVASVATHRFPVSASESLDQGV